jgi:hypothetical protein
MKNRQSFSNMHPTSHYYQLLWQNFGKNSAGIRFSLSLVYLTFSGHLVFMKINILRLCGRTFSLSHLIFNAAEHSRAGCNTAAWVDATYWLDCRDALKTVMHKMRYLPRFFSITIRVLVLPTPVKLTKNSMLRCTILVKTINAFPSRLPSVVDPGMTFSDPDPTCQMVSDHTWILHLYPRLVIVFGCILWREASFLGEIFMEKFWKFIFF